MIRPLLPLVVPAMLLAGCGTASFVPVVSNPPGARIFVAGVDTGEVSPATIDIEDFAPDPDQPMTVEVRLAGFVPTFSPPYEPRHQCWILPCEHKQRHHLPCHLPLLREGSGVRIDTRRPDYEVSVDGGPWQLVNGPPMHQRSGDDRDQEEAQFGLTLPAPPGRRRFAWRPRDAAKRRGTPEAQAWLLIPDPGYVAVDFDLSPIHRVDTYDRPVARTATAGRVAGTQAPLCFSTSEAGSPGQKSEW